MQARISRTLIDSLGNEDDNSEMSEYAAEMSLDMMTLFADAQKQLTHIMRCESWPIATLKLTSLMDKIDTYIRHTRSGIAGALNVKKDQRIEKKHISSHIGYPKNRRKRRDSIRNDLEIICPISPIPPTSEFLNKNQAPPKPFYETMAPNDCSRRQDNIADPLKQGPVTYDQIMKRQAEMIATQKKDHVTQNDTNGIEEISDDGVEEDMDHINVDLENDDEAIDEMGIGVSFKDILNAPRPGPFANMKPYVYTEYIRGVFAEADQIIASRYPNLDQNSPQFKQLRSVEGIKKIKAYVARKSKRT